MRFRPAFPIGQIALGVHYRQGRAVPRDIEAAAKWFRKAAERGDSKAGENLRRLEALPPVSPE